MQLIADSGSTKTSWWLVKNKKTITKAATIGYNPHYLSTTDIVTSLKKSLLPQLNQPTTQIKNIYFYGAGCTSPNDNSIVEKAFSFIFPQATTTVESDMIGAARGLCGHQIGVVCILGTGSNSCFFDGKTIIDNIPSLGFVLGDEGSGAYLGKQLIKAFFYRELPKTLHQSFITRYQLSRPALLDRVYRQPMPNKYMANFTHFISEHIEHPFLQDLVQQAFDTFLVHHILKYKNVEAYPINFLGSIALVFKPQLQNALMQHGLKLGKIVKAPIESIVAYHT